MCCCDSKTKGCGTVSRFFLTIINLVLILIDASCIFWSIIWEIEGVLKPYGISYTPNVISYFISLIIYSVGCSAACCP